MIEKIFADQRKPCEWMKLYLADTDGKIEISVHRRRKCRFDFENEEEKIVGGRRGKLAKNQDRNQSSPVCCSHAIS